MHHLGFLLGPRINAGGRIGNAALGAMLLATDDDLEAERIAMRIVGELGVTGVMAVEMFETEDGRLLVNELAMRPHNTGHWT